jgi:hypothetical protein
MSRFVWSLMNQRKRDARQALRAIHERRRQLGANKEFTGPCLPACPLCGDRASRHCAEGWFCSYCEPQLQEVAS